MGTKLLLGLIVLSASACKTMGLPSSSTKIVNGDKLIASDALAKHTVTVAKKEPGKPLAASCTASLVARDLLITAAHCLQDGGEFVALFGLDNKNRVAEISIKETRPHPSFKNSDSRFDIAWLRLSSPAPLEFEPIAVLTDDSKLEDKPSLTVVGGGFTGAQCEEDDCTGTLFKLDLKVLGSHHNKFASDLLILEEKADKAVCHGDSGGPAILRLNHQNLLAAVVHGANAALTGLPAKPLEAGVPRPPCVNTRTLYTSLPAYVEWIEQSSSVKLVRDSSIVLADKVNDSLESNDPKNLEELIRSAKEGSDLYTAITNFYSFMIQDQRLNFDEVLKIYQNPAYAASKIARIDSINTNANGPIINFKDPQILKYLPSLKQIRIKNYVEPEIFFPVLAEHPKLEELELNQNFEYKDQDGVQKNLLSKLPNLKILYVNMVRGELDCAVFASIKGLKSLSTSHCARSKKSGNRFDFLVSLPVLEKFHYFGYLNQQDPGETLPGSTLPAMKDFYVGVGENLETHVRLDLLPNLETLNLKFLMDLDLSKPLPLPHLKQLVLGGFESYTKERLLAFKALMPSLKVIEYGAERL